MAASPKVPDGAAIAPEEAVYSDAELSTFSQNVQALESRLFRIELALQVKPIDHNRINVYLGEIGSIMQETQQQSRRAYEINGESDPNVQRLLTLAPRMVEIQRIAALEIASYEGNISSLAAEKVAAEARFGARMAALDAVNARIKTAVTDDDKLQAMAAYQAYLKEHSGLEHPVPLDDGSAPPGDDYESPVADKVDSDLLNDEDKNMNAPSREEFDAKILASEARMETRVTRIEGSINTYLARSDGIEKSILLLSQQAAKAAQDAAQAAAQAAQQATGIKTTLWVTALTTILSVLAMAISLYFATQSSNIGIVQATLAAFESGKSHGEKSGSEVTPVTPADQSPAASKDAK